MTIIVAEISCNHEGSLNKALELLQLARTSGADAAKIQLFTPEEMSQDPDALDTYRKNVTPREWVPKLFEYASSLDLDLFASVFSEADIAFIKPFDPPYVKIASFENNHWPLLRYAAESHIPVVMSTGMIASYHELRATIDHLMDSGCTDLTVMKCTSQYPSKLVEIKTLKDESGSIPLFNVGFSDHTVTGEASVVASVLGATMIERHIALDNVAPDSEFASIGSAFRDYVAAIRRAERMLGDAWTPMKTWQRNADELHKLRRGIYATRDIKANDILSVDNMAILRGNGDGMHPRFWDKAQGRVAKTPISKGEPIKDEHFR